MPPQATPAKDDDLFDRSEDGTLCVRLQGDWRAGELPLSLQDVDAEVAVSPVSRMTFETTRLGDWDSGLPAFLMKLRALCEERDATFDPENLPSGLKRLLEMSASVGRRDMSYGGESRRPFLERVADRSYRGWKAVVDRVEFLGEVTVAFSRLLTCRACFRPSQLLVLMQQCGVQALPIVSLISLLVGVIFAFVGATPLAMFDGEIYVASLVGIVIVRVMGAIMTGIIMSGRTGAAFSAHLGSMQVNDEIDALSTLGIDPVEFLVLPRILALTLMMPLLCIFADMMGILGGLFVGVFLLDLNAMEYLIMTRNAVELNDFWIGLFHSVVFGVLVAMEGCLRGLQCGRSAAAVGEATTSAVTTAIVNIIVATAIITVLCNILGI
ncbi:MAG: ABC transporter permease [Desulfuromonadales bacterium]